MSSLFEITANLAALEELIDRQEDPADVEKMVVESLSLKQQLKEKVENYAGLIQHLEGLAEIRKKEADRLARLAKTTEVKADRLREALKNGLKYVNVEKVVTNRYEVSIRKNGGKTPLVITEENIIPDEWKKTKTVVELDKDKIREALEGGELLDFAELKDRGDSLVIR